MADNGELYRIFQPEFATGMRSLCRKADIIVPNLTEAALLLEESYHPGPYTQAYIEKILKKLSKLGPKKIVLTGVYFEEKKLGAATTTKGKIRQTTCFPKGYQEVITEQEMFLRAPCYPAC